MNYVAYATVYPAEHGKRRGYIVAITRAFITRRQDERTV